MSVAHYSGVWKKGSKNYKRKTEQKEKAEDNTAASNKDKEGGNKK